MTFQCGSQFPAMGKRVYFFKKRKKKCMDEDYPHITFLQANNSIPSEHVFACVLSRVLLVPTP